jgi:protein TonB
MVSRGWLYGLMVLLAQTCNPYYSANDSRNQGLSREDIGIIEIPDEAMMLDEDIEIAPPREVEPPPPPPMPEAVVPEKETVFKIVEDMPRFPGCENQGLSRQDAKTCAQEELTKFVYGNLKYPAIARENGVEGRVILQWVVNPDGSIRDINVLRDPGARCGAEATRIIKMMPKWIPGKQRGRPVPVQYTFPVQFKLEKK